MPPKIEDVMYCLLNDTEATYFDSYESWAKEFGYDADSRKAESIYQASLKIGLKLRNSLGEAIIDELKTAFKDY
jgi:hypothetical protein